MQVRNRLDDSLHVAVVHLPVQEGPRAAQLVLDPRLPERRTIGPVEAAIGLEVLQATHTETRALNRAGFAVQARGRCGRQLAGLTAVLRETRLHRLAHHHASVPKTGRHGR